MNDTEAEKTDGLGHRWPTFNKGDEVECLNCGAKVYVSHYFGDDNLMRTKVRKVEPSVTQACSAAEG